MKEAPGSITIGFRCSAALRKSLDKLAAASGMDRSKYIVQILSAAADARALVHPEYRVEPAPGKVSFPPGNPRAADAPGTFRSSTFVLNDAP